MSGFHVTTTKKLGRYKATGAILPPVRFWPNELTVRLWMKRTGRDVLLRFDLPDLHFPMPDHIPARWTPRVIRRWEVEDRLDKTR